MRSLSAIACAIGIAGCIGARSARPEPPTERAVEIVVPPAKRDDETAARLPPPVPDDVDGRTGALQPALRKTSLTRFATTTEACKGLVDKSSSMVIRNAPGTYTNKRTACRARQLVITEPPLPGRQPLLLEFRRTTSFPRHADVDSVVAAPAIPVGATDLAVPLDAREESEAMVSMPKGDESGHVELTDARDVDVTGDKEAEVIVVLTAFDSARETDRTDFIVCDAAGAWCTEPATLFTATHGDRAAAARNYAFKRHERGVEVTTTGEPPVPVRVFPL